MSNGHVEIPRQHGDCPPGKGAEPIEDPQAPEITLDHVCNSLYQIEIWVRAVRQALCAKCDRDKVVGRAPIKIGHGGA